LVEKDKFRIQRFVWDHQPESEDIRFKIGGVVLVETEQIGRVTRELELSAIFHEVFIGERWYQR
jgi:hypothetical protein